MNQPGDRRSKLVLFGGAGLLGQNLVVQLQRRGHRALVVIDKHAANLGVLRGMHPEVTAIHADMAVSGPWQDAVQGAGAAVMLQAQIGGEVAGEFERNNIDSTRHALDACHRHSVPYLVHISSSVVNSMARDWYTESKKAQEEMVIRGPIPYCILRPTLMFGWFDRKHLGWLSRFMRRAPVFPIPGSGRYTRQPLYARDFCEIILSCLETRPMRKIYDITGREKIDYIDIIRKIKEVSGARTRIVRIPYWTFWLLLKTFALFSRDPPFTTKQLAALVTPDEFEVIDWWNIFSVKSTPFEVALRETFCDPVYSKIALQF
jgi:nucleoside-diphosphate-sugar epimerase